MIIRPTIVALLLFLIAPGAALAAARYPDRPIHVVVGFPPGSAVDAAARLIMPKLAEAWPTCVIENVLGRRATLRRIASSNRRRTATR